MLWFKARDYGWGWTPVTLQGWIVVGLFVVAATSTVLYFMYRVRTGIAPGQAAISCAIWLIVLIAALIAIAWATGEPPR